MSTVIRAVTFLVLAGIAGADASGQGEPRVLALSPTRSPALVRPLADGRALLLYREAYRGFTPAGASSVELRATGGVVQFERRPGLDVPGATMVTVLDTTVSAAGQIVVSMVAVRQGAGDAHVLAYYSDAAPAQIRLVTTEVACLRLAPAAGKGLWCLGPHVARHNAGDTGFSFVHHFSEDGRLLASIGERRTFSGAPSPWDPASQLTALGDTIVVWMVARGELVTFGALGKVVERLAVPKAPIATDPRTDFILGSDGTLLALGITEQPTESLDSWRRDLFVLSAGVSAWQRTRVQGLSLAARLVGASGSAVTFWDRRDSCLVTLGLRDVH